MDLPCVDLTPRKPHPFGNEYHTIADGLTNILINYEIVIGKYEPNLSIKNLMRRERELIYYSIS